MIDSVPNSPQDTRDSPFTFEQDRQIMRELLLRMTDEQTILKSAIDAYLYARSTIKGRWERGEEIISTCPEASYLYAKNVINGRWEQGEDAIGQSTTYMGAYATEVIGGRLPDHLHARMILSSPDAWTRHYINRYGA